MTQSSPAAPVASTDPLQGLTIPVPCTVPWETMTGDARVRFCGQCRLHVHDLSAMTGDEAVAFLRAKAPGARVCVRFRRRPDGRVVTADCLEAVRALRRRAWLAAAAVCGALGLGGAAWARSAAADHDGGFSNPDLWERAPFSALAKVLPSSWLPRRSPPPMVGVLIAPTPPPGGTPPSGRTVPGGDSPR